MNTLKRAWPKLFHSKGTLTSSTIPSQIGKVIIITGSTAGIVLELTKALYNPGTTVYIATRNRDKADAAIADLVRDTTSENKGTLHFLPLDLDDLRTVKPFFQPLDRRTVQSLEPHVGVNCVAPYLLTQLLAPLLCNTATHPDTAPNSVRIIWSTSMLVEFLALPEGVPPAELETPSPDPNRNYAISKTWNWFLADRLARQLGPHGVVSLAQNPGNIYTGIIDEAPKLTVWLSIPLYYTPVEGAQTMLWAVLAHDLTVQDGGRFAILFGRWHPGPRTDSLDAMKEVGREELRESV